MLPTSVPTHSRPSLASRARSGLRVEAPLSVRMTAWRSTLPSCMPAARLLSSAWHAVCLGPAYTGTRSRDYVSLMSVWWRWISLDVLWRVWVGNGGETARGFGSGRVEGPGWGPGEAERSHIWLSRRGCPEDSWCDKVAEAGGISGGCVWFCCVDASLASSLCKTLCAAAHIICVVFCPTAQRSQGRSACPPQSLWRVCHVEHYGIIRMM